jgi:hypothetical protein
MPRWSWEAADVAFAMAPVLHLDGGSAPRAVVRPPVGLAGTVVNRWLVLDFRMPIAFRPLPPAITASFDKENLRTMAAVKQYAETHAGDGVAGGPQALPERS